MNNYESKKYDDQTSIFGHISPAGSSQTHVTVSMKVLKDSIKYKRMRKLAKQVNANKKLSALK